MSAAVFYDTILYKNGPAGRETGRENGDNRMSEKKQLAKTYEPGEVEDRIYRFWLESEML